MKTANDGNKLNFVKCDSYDILYKNNGSAVMQYYVRNRFNLEIPFLGLVGSKLTRQKLKSSKRPM